MNRETLETISLATKYYGLKDMPLEEGMEIINSQLDLNDIDKTLNSIQMDVITFGTKAIEDSYNAECAKHLPEPPKEIIIEL